MTLSGQESGAGLSGSLSNQRNETDYAKRFKMVVTQNPYMAEHPDAVMAMVSSGLSGTDLATQSGAIYAAQMGAGYRNQLERLSGPTQRSIYATLPVQQQQVLAQMGYKTPEEDDESWLHRSLGPLGSAADLVIGTPIHLIGNVVKPVGSATLDVLNFVANTPGYIYRSIRTMDDPAQLAALGGAIIGGAAGLAAAPFTGGASLVAAGAVIGGALAGASAGAAAEKLITLNPDDIWQAFRPSNSWHGERTFDRPSRARAHEILGEPRLVTMAADFAREGFNAESLAKEIAGSPGDQAHLMQTLDKLAQKSGPQGSSAYQAAYDAMVVMVQDSTFQRAVSTLQKGKISFGRDVVDTFTPFDPGTTAYNLLSGSLDAAFMIASDPILMGTAWYETARFAARGFMLAEGAQDASNIRRIVEGNKDVARLWDNVAEAVRTKDFNKVRALGPGFEDNFITLLNWERNNGRLAGTAAGKFDGKALLDWAVSERQITPLLAGMGIKRGTSGVVLSQLKEGHKAWQTWARQMRALTDGLADAKIERKATKLAEESGDRNLTTLLNERGRAEAEARGVAWEPWNYKQAFPETYAFGKAAGDLPLVGRFFAGMGDFGTAISTMIPRGGVVSLTGENAPREIRAVTELGRYLNMPSYMRRQWADIIMSSPNVNMRAQAMMGFIEDAVISAGMDVLPEGRRLINEFVTRHSHIYALGADDFVTSHSFAGNMIRSEGFRGINFGDLAVEMHVPDLTAIRRAVKGGLLSKMIGITDLPVLEQAMNRFWKPSVLMRIGFIPRAAGEEMINFMLRGGIGGLGQETAARSIGRKRAYDETMRLVAAGKRAELNPSQVRLYLEGPLVGHLRGVSNMVARYGGSHPMHAKLESYSNAVRGFWEKGFDTAGGLERTIASIGEGATPGLFSRRNVAENLQSIVFGKELSWRRMLKGGVNDDLVKAADKFYALHSTALMREVSAVNANTLTSGSNKEKLMHFSGIDPVTGEMVTTPYIVLRGNFQRYAANDPLYANMFAHKLTTIAEDPIHQQVIHDLPTVFPPHWADQRAEVATWVDQYRKAESETTHILLDEFIAEGVKDRRAFWGGVGNLERLDPKLVAELRTILPQSGQLTWDDMVAAMEKVVENARLKKSPQLHWHEQALGEMKQAKLLLARLEQLPAEDRQWASAFLRYARNEGINGSHVRANVRPGAFDGPGGIVGPRRSVRVLITGGRDYADEAKIEEALRWAAERYGNDLTIVHGGAKGADSLADRVARRLGLPVEEYRPNWRPNGPSGPVDRGAAFKRNQQMIDTQPDLVLGFKDGFDHTLTKGGTEDQIRRAMEAGNAPDIHLFGDGKRIGMRTNRLDGTPTTSASADQVARLTDELGVLEAERTALYHHMTEIDFRGDPDHLRDQIEKINIKIDQARLQLTTPTDALDPLENQRLFDEALQHVADGTHDLRAIELHVLSQRKADLEARLRREPPYDWQGQTPQDYADQADIAEQIDALDTRMTGLHDQLQAAGGGGGSTPTLRTAGSGGNDPLIYRSLQEYVDAHASQYSARISDPSNQVFTQAGTRQGDTMDNLSEGLVRVWVPPAFTRHADGTEVTFDELYNLATNRPLLDRYRNVVESMLGHNQATDRAYAETVMLADRQLASELDLIHHRLYGTDPAIGGERVRYAEFPHPILDGRRHFEQRVIDPAGTGQGVVQNQEVIRAITDHHVPGQRDPLKSRQVTSWIAPQRTLETHLKPISEMSDLQANMDSWGHTMAQQINQWFGKGTSERLKFRPDRVMVDEVAADGTVVPALRDAPRLYQKDATGELVSVGLDETPDPSRTYYRLSRKLGNDTPKIVTWGDKEFFMPLDVSVPGAEVAWAHVGPVIHDVLDKRMGRTRFVPGESLERVQGILRPSAEVVHAPRFRVDHIDTLNAPNHVIGPSLRAPSDNKWDGFVRWGFDRVIGPSIDSLARRPMAFHFFQEHWRNGMKVRNWLRDENLTKRINEMLDNKVFADKAVGEEAQAITKNLKTVIAYDGDATALNWTDAEVLAFARGHTPEELKTLIEGVKVRSAGQTDPASRLANVEATQLGRRNLDAVLTQVSPTFKTDDFLAYVRSQVPEGRLEDLSGLMNDLGKGEFGSHPILGQLDDNDWRLLHQAEMNYKHTADEVGELAAVAAINEMMPFIDSHELRTQFAEYGKGFLPFWYAEENFMKRWARTLFDEGPAMIRKAQYGFMGLKHAGVIREDQQGKTWFVYPGSQLLLETMDKLVPGYNLLGTGVAFQTPTDSMFPGLTSDSSRLGVPAFGPLVSLPMSMATAFVPELKPLNLTMFGSQASTLNSNVIRQLVPAALYNIFTAAFAGDGNAQYASAQMAAIAQLEATGNGLPENAGPAERDEFLRKVRDHARIVMVARALTGFVVPGAPSPITTGEDGMFHTSIGVTNPKEVFSAEYQQLMQSLGIEQGTIRFLELHPVSDLTDIVNPMAYTTGMSESPSGAPLPATELAMTFYDQNTSFFQAFPDAAPWLLPQDPFAEGERSAYAYDQQTITGLRKRRTPTEFLTAIKFKEAAGPYFARKTQNLKDVDVARNSGDKDLVRLLQADWTTWSTSYKLMHPTFAAELEGGDGGERRRRVIQQMRVALKDPASPRAGHFDLVMQMFDNFDRYEGALLDAREDTSMAGRARTERIKEVWDNWGQQMVLANPVLASIWTSVLRPESGLD